MFSKTAEDFDFARGGHGSPDLKEIPKTRLPQREIRLLFERCYVQAEAHLRIG